MSQALKIDFVSDVACPWCAIGLAALQQALTRLGEDAQVALHFQPFELNPELPKGGQDLSEYLTEKYGSNPEQQQQIYQRISQLGADLGFVFAPQGRGRIYNTLDAHRLLFWAQTLGADEQLALKKAFFTAYQGRGERIDEPSVLLNCVAEAGLNRSEAEAILQSDRYRHEVREREQFYQRSGVSSVPATIVNDRHLISGGQPVEVFEQALRQILAGEVE